MLLLAATWFGSDPEGDPNGSDIIPPAEPATVDETTLPDFNQVYESYHGKVLSYAAKLLGRDDADDISQEVFVKIGRSLATLSDPAKLTSWVYAITLNTVRDAARRRAAAPDRKSLETHSSPEDAEGIAVLRCLPGSAQRTPEENAIRNEMVACYLDYVRALPANYYEVYVLSEFAHLSNEEIAQRLSLSVGTVKIRLHRARTQLNDALRRNCRCYFNQRGELMGEPKTR